MTWCELRLPGCTNRAKERHHRRRRSQGGTDDPSNVLDLCQNCHNGNGIHQHIAWSNRHGLLLRTGDDPAVLVTSCDLTCDTDHREIL